MLKYGTKVLIVLLTIVSTVSIINVIMMYWIPINIPLNSFSVMRLTFVALIEKKYYLIIVSMLISVLLYLTTVAIRKQKILLPVLSLLYLLYDFVIVVLLFIDGLNDGYWGTYIIQTIILSTLILLLARYCWLYLKDKK